MKPEPVKTVGELIEALQRYPATAAVEAAWEGTSQEIYVCQNPNGTVTLDVDNGWLAEQYAVKKAKKE